jgi:heat-inducible transcriptional repressor
MIPERSIEVLRAIVSDYIATSQPVGSKALVDRHGFAVSAATIRNDMALLEDEGLIAQTHTSSGRVPTDRGYRLFVDRLEQVKPLTEGERAAMESFLAGGADLDDLLARSVRVLSQITRQVALVQYPTMAKSKIRNIEIVPLSEHKVAVVLVDDAEHVDNRTLDLGVVVDQAFMGELRAKLNAALVGTPLPEVDAKLNEFLTQFNPQRAREVQAVLDGISEQIDATRSTKLLVSGASYLAQSEGDFQRNLSPLLRAMEEQVVLLKLVGEMEADENGVALRIGHENEFEGLNEASVVVSSYEESGARVGVIGPTRMNYSANIAAVRAIARYLTKALGA